MTCEEILDQAIAMLQRRGRLTYGALKRQFQLDDAYLEDLKAELIEGQRVAVDDDGRVLVWTGAEVSAPQPTPPSVSSQDRLPLAYTPPYLAEKILTSKGTLEGERKQATVLFADLKGSLALLADRDPEEARRLLDPVLERMMAAVHRYEGTVNQVMGGGIMALLGAPIAHEDHAVRACYAALAMQAAVQHYAAEVQRTHRVPLQMRVGMNAGEVVVRAISNDLHMDYSAVGQTTHLAARMEQMAMPGSSLITPAVLGLAQGYVHVRALGPVPVKGLDAPLDVYELVGASGIRRRLQATAARGLTRFVGRDTELAALMQALEQAKAGHGQVAAVVGEAGVGKSRLVYECLHSHHTQSWRVFESASVSYGKATPYFPVIDLLKRYAHVDEEDDPRTVRAKMTGQILTLDETLQDTLPALLSLLDALPADSPPLGSSIRRSAVSARSTPSNGCCCARARCSRCWWSSKTCTGSTLKRRPCLTAWSRSCLPPRVSTRLGQVFAYMTLHFMVIDLDQALESGQRTLALATAHGDIGLQVMAHCYVGFVYYDLGHYRRAVDCLGWNMASLEGDLLREHFGMTGLPSVLSRVHLSWSLAELGAFAEGVARGEEGVRIAEAADHPFSLLWAYAGIGHLYLRKGDVHRSIPVLERGSGLCQDWHIPVLFPGWPCP
jgi:class 3 adenylate cyclase